MARVKLALAGGKGKSRTPLKAKSKLVPLGSEVERRVKKPHRFKAGTRAKFEARRLIKRTKPLISKACVMRIMRDAPMVAEGSFKFQRSCVDLIQEAAEVSRCRRGVFFLIGAAQAAVMDVLRLSHIIRQIDHTRKTLTSKCFTVARSIWLEKTKIDLCGSKFVSTDNVPNK